MQTGAFAMIDCLGWKGIWQRLGQNPTAVLDKVRRIERLAGRRKKKLSDGLSEFNVDIKPTVLFLSDTVVIGIPDSHPFEQELVDPHIPAMSVEMACALVINILNLFIEEEPYLALRGFVTHGEYSIKGNFIVGPAVDQAAENCEIADGAFVWLHASASEAMGELYDFRRRLVSELNRTLENPEYPERETHRRIHAVTTANLAAPLLIEDYPMPLNNGRILDCSIVNPFVMIEGTDDRADLFNRYSKSFESSNIDVVMKRQNTFKFFRVAADKTAYFYENDYDPNLADELFSDLLNKEKMP